MKILLIDSHVLYRRALAEYLLGHGYRIDGVGTAEEGIDKLSEGERYVAAIMEFNGNERFLLEYRDIRPGIPVLVVTGEPDWETAVVALGGGRRAPAVCYLNKNDPEMYQLLIAELVANTQILAYRGFVLDLRTYKVTYRENPVRLSKLEVDLLAHFLRNPERRIDYLELAKVAEYEDVSTVGMARNKLAGSMSKFRGRLKKACGGEVINSVQGAGFLLSLAGINRKTASEANSPIIQPAS